jgi:predicted nucleotidyltransferase
MTFGLHHETLKKIREVFLNSKEIKKVVIFGSRARGDYNETSDIDIGLYLDGKLESGIIDNINIAAGIYKTNVLIVEEVVNKKLKENIEREGIIIYQNTLKGNTY